MLDTSTGGEYHFFEHATHKLTPRDRTKLHNQYIGFVFQQYHLLDQVTHSEANAAHSRRIIQLKDGWIASE